MSIRDDIMSTPPDAVPTPGQDEIEQACNEHRAEVGLPPIDMSGKRYCPTEKCRDGCPFDPALDLG